MKRTENIAQRQRERERQRERRHVREIVDTVPGETCLQPLWGNCICARADKERDERDGHQKHQAHLQLQSERRKERERQTDRERD